MNKQKIIKAAEEGKTLYHLASSDWIAIQILKYDGGIKGLKKWTVQDVATGKIFQT